MTSLKQAVQQSLKQILKRNSLISQRVVSTSCRKDQGLMAAQLEMDLSQNQQHRCPFRPSVDNLTETVDAPVEQKVSSAQPFENIPGPKGLPVVGTLFEYFKKDGPRFSQMFEVQKQRSLQYGEIYFEKIADFESVIISNPDEYKRLVRTEGKYPIRREMEPMSYYNKIKGYTLGIVNSQGEEWYKLRTVASKKMLRLSEVNRISDEVGQVADDFVHRLETLRDPQGHVQSLEKEVFKWALESIGVFLFEERIGCLCDQPTPNVTSFVDNVAGFFKTLQPLMYSLPLYQIWPTKTWKKFEKYYDNIMELGNTLVQKKLSSMKHEGDSKSALISYLVDSNLTSKEINGLLTEILTAAVETTSSATIWTMYNLARNPRVQEDLYREIMEASAKNGGALSAENLGKLPLVKAVLKETLRMYPIAYTSSRYISEDIELCGYKIPAGTHVQANLYGMFHNPDYFPEPEKFLPERWLKDNKMDADIKSASQLVWGHGARMCLGRRLAEQEMHITISKIVQNFQLSYHGDEVKPTLHTTMVPDKPIRIEFTPRQQT